MLAHSHRDTLSCFMVLLAQALVRKVGGNVEHITVREFKDGVKQKIPWLSYN